MPSSEPVAATDVGGSGSRPNDSAGSVAAVTLEQEDDLRVWILSRPEAIQQAVAKLPPACTVRATVPLGIPAPGCIGQVVSYLQPGKDGRVGVRVRGRWNGDGPFMDAHCNADELELVDEGVVTCAFVRSVLAEKSA